MRPHLTERIGEELTARSLGNITRQRLEFDPRTGELVVRPADELPAEGATPVDQIASDGFA